ncbi:hypothetical protein SAMN06298216_4447 [Spirosomataceae bacterium TFI 002]|nr:hypothetical protein SAMN06298216_4447 [Spirosomataceae bacterium TFI 002]
MTKNKSITFRVSDEMMEEIVSKSSHQNLTVSKWIENLINKELESKRVDKVSNQSTTTFGGFFIGFVLLSLIAMVTNLLTKRSKNI